MSAPTQGRSHGLTSGAALGSAPLDRASCCYAKQDSVTKRSIACHGNPCPPPHVSVSSVGWPGCSAMARHRAPTARPVAGTRRNGRLRAPRCPARFRRSRRCRGTRARCVPGSIRLPVPGATKWRPWSSTLAQPHAPVVRPAARTQRVRVRPRGCARCAHAGSRQRRLLRGLSPRNIAGSCLLFAAGWGAPQEVWMQEPPAQEPRPLRVRISFAPTRLAAAHLAAAYASVVPPTGRRTAAAIPAPPSAPAEQAPREQELA
jgi:hypothetical protein